MADKRFVCGQRSPFSLLLLLPSATLDSLYPGQTDRPFGDGRRPTSTTDEREIDRCERLPRMAGANTTLLTTQL